MIKEEVVSLRDEAFKHLTTELLPFWTNRMIDKVNGGFLTHFDKNGNDSGEDEKSLIAQTRCLYTISSSHRAGYGNGKYAELDKLKKEYEQYAGARLPNHEDQLRLLEQMYKTFKECSDEYSEKKGMSTKSEEALFGGNKNDDTKI